MKTLYDFTVVDITGQAHDLSQHKGKKVMIVNTASECGFTPQYEQLQELHEAHGDKLVIIGFPSNDFGAQEPGSEKQIANFCSKNYGVTFLMMSKVIVTGDDKHALYQWLTSKDMNGVSEYTVEWNFHKFLIDEKGKLIKELKPQVLPIDEEVLTWIEG